MEAFCTLFDSSYLIRGLTLYKSLSDHLEQFVLYVLPIDNECEDILHELNLPNIEVISYNEFLNDSLKEIRKNRSRAEFCWTCTPHIIEYVLEKCGASRVTYLDADLFFYSNPICLIEEMEEGNKEVLIVEHRYSKELEYLSDKAGKYNVEFMCFKNSENAWEVLKVWSDLCDEWCFSRFESTRFGDQKYLDNWKEKYQCVHVLKNIGGGVAPWNVYGYELKNNGDVYSVDGVPIVFFHYHDFTIISDNEYKSSIKYGATDNKILVQLYDGYFSAIQKSMGLVASRIPWFGRYYDANQSRMKDKLFWNLDLKDFCELINQLRDNRPISLWGYGKNGKRIYDLCIRGGLNIDLVVDANYENYTFENIIISSPEKLKEKNYFVIVTPLNYQDKIVDALEKWNYKEKKDFYRFGELESLTLAKRYFDI